MPIPTPEPLAAAAAPTRPDVHAARERAIALLTDRYADGTLDDAAFESRLVRLQAAPDAASLDALAHDLARTAPPATATRGWIDPVAPTPPAAAPAMPPAPPVHGEPRIRAVLGEVRRRGWWVVPGHLEVSAVLGDVRLDFRDAAIPDVVHVVVDAMLGAITLVVPPDVTVGFEVSAVLGSAVNRARTLPPAPGVPHLRVTGSAMLGEVKVVVRARGA